MQHRTASSGTSRWSSRNWPSDRVSALVSAFVFVAALIMVPETARAEGPLAGLLWDGQSTFYGATSGGGTLFEVDSTGNETILHTFGGSGDGTDPSAGVIMDAHRNLFGTTRSGGAHSYGTVFQANPNGAYKVLYSFLGRVHSDGSAPWGGLVMDAQGNLYGTTASGGAHGLGTVFKLTPLGTETVLHSFAGASVGDGQGPEVGLVMDAQGNLYGTTTFGGAYNHGTIFKVTP